METTRTFIEHLKILPLIKSNTIPPMTHPYGKHWDQPDTRLIKITTEDAKMNKKTFDKLSDYSNSQPSGCYEGKMWRAKRGKDKEWFLCWFGFTSDPNICSNNYRKIIIID